MNEWGWNPSTFEALGTVGASFVAVIALLVSLLARSNQRRSDRAAQAVLVTISRALDEEQVVAGDRETTSFTIRNDSDQPVFYLQFMIDMGPTSLRELLLTAFDRPPEGGRITDIHRIVAENHFPGRAKTGMFWSFHLHHSLVRVAPTDWPVRLDPHSEVTLSITLINGYSLGFPAGFCVGVIFRDSQNRWWTRRLDNVLIPGSRLSRFRRNR